MTILADAHEDLLIGAMVLNPAIIAEVATELSATDFASDDIAKAFATLVDATDAKLPLETELRKLIRSGESKLDMRWLANIVTNAQTREYRYHIDQIKRLAQLRKLAKAIDSALKALNAGDDPTAIESNLQLHLDAAKKSQSKGGEDHAEIIDQLILEMASGKTPEPIFTGLASLDYDLGGLLPGELVVIGGRPGTGKTVLGMQIAKHNAAAKNKHVTVVTMEMKNPELVKRMICGAAKIDSRDVRLHRLPKEQKQNYIQTAEAIRHWPIRYWDEPAIDVVHLAHIARFAKARYNTQLLIVDYLGLLEPTERRQSEQEKLSEASRKLKVLANELEIPVVVLVQLNREADGSRPRLATIRGSGAIEQDANIVMFTHSENQKDFILIEKHRNGECCAVEVVFDRQTTTMIDPNTITIGGNPHYPDAFVETDGTRWRQ